jgi:hypothetical protein
MKPVYSFCEFSPAASLSPWHIREVGPEGLKPSGGARGVSLCRRLFRWDGGWDVRAEIADTLLNDPLCVCQKCVIEYRYRIKRDAKKANRE